ncbi:Ganglioside GM2 activator [Bulinus truncatus]|nr:Ganglioside GM2 activator [Bulinus truncatus]
MFQFQHLLLLGIFMSTTLLSNVLGDSVIRRMVIEEIETKDDKSSAELKNSQTELMFNISEHKLFKFLSDVQAASKFFQRPINSFSWDQCDSGSAQLLKINSLNLSPDPLQLPGTIYFSFNVDLSQAFSELEASVVVKKKMGFLWIEIPCIHGLGSCTYNNLCQRLAGVTCPQPFVDNKVPCKCPFTQLTPYVKMFLKYHDPIKRCAVKYILNFIGLYSCKQFYFSFEKKKRIFKIVFYIFTLKEYELYVLNKFYKYKNCFEIL